MPDSTPAPDGASPPAPERCTGMRWGLQCIAQTGHRREHRALIDHEPGIIWWVD